VKPAIRNTTNILNKGSLAMKKIQVSIASEEISLPVGYFLVTKSFELTPGGGWSVGFKKGWLLKYDSTKKLYVFNQKTNELISHTPPISGTENFDISRYGRNPERREMLDAFTGSTKQITPKEFKKLCNEKSAEGKKQMTVKEALVYLKTLDLKQTVTITLNY
jgi:hypothetical protein